MQEHARSSFAGKLLEPIESDRGATAGVGLSVAIHLGVGQVVQRVTRRCFSIGSAYSAGVE